MISNFNNDSRATVGRTSHTQQPATVQREPGRRPPVQGHIRHPVLAREPSALESIRSITSSTLRALPAVFSPATKNNTPGASPASQQRSTAHSYGSFVGSTHAAIPVAASPTATPPTWSPFLPPPTDSQGAVTSFPPHGTNNPELLPPEAQTEHITWSSWEDVDSAAGKKRLLLLGYSSGLQVWELTSIDGIQEILNVNLTSFISSPGYWIVSRATVLPTPTKTTDEFADARPLLAIVAKEVSESWQTGPTELLVYSLKSHTVVKRLGIPPLDDPKFGAESSSVGSDPGEDFSSVYEIAANSNLVAISTYSPVAIHILSAATLRTVYTITAEHLTPTKYSESPDHPPPHPTFALSQRMIAFASPPPLPGHRGSKGGYLSTSVASSTNGFSPTLTAIGAGSMDLVGTGAKKVGEGVWMGMKALGGLAFGSAAGNGMQQPPISPPIVDPRAAHFSRSAPSAGLGVSPPGLLLSPPLAPLSPMSPGMKSKRSSFGGGSGESVLHPPVESGWVTILDLAPIMRERGGKTSPLSSEVKPTLIAEFLATSTAPSVIPSATPHPAAIQLLSFSPSGTALCVCDVYGHVAKVFQVRGSLRGVRDPGTWSSSAQEKEKGTISPGTPGRRPSSLGDRAAAMNARRRSSGASSLSTSSNQLQVKDVGDTVRHMYDLIRGTTHAKVEHVSWSDDARWIGVGTSRGTFHTYAINPYGGKPDELSHLDGRVRNPDSLQSWPVSVHPVIRFKETAKEKYPAPIFKFLPLSVSRSSSILSPSLDRPSRSHNVSSSSMGRSSSAPSDNKILGKTGWQDVMTFAPPNGLLTLRRCVVSPALNNHANDPAAAAAAARRGPGAASGVSMMMNLVGSAGATQEAILKASETLVASWDLKRDSSWDEVKSSIGGGASRRRQEPSTPSDALSKAELSTSSKSPHILPPSVYASHQFNFFALSEDWEAPLRQAHFDLPTRKIEVRKEVEILSGGQPIGSVGSSFKSALRYDDGEAFIQEFDAGQGTTTSIERPIATAISTNIDAQAAEQVIPSFPNAYKPSSWRDSIVPVRTVAAGVAGGVGEGIGRIKREISKARAANKGQQTSSSERVNEAPSLAFDEDDESIFAQEDDPSAATTGHGGLQLPHSGDSATGSVPSTNGPETDHSRDDVSDAWSENQEEVDKVLAEAATFDEIAASGFMMEEEQERRRLKGELDDTAATPRGKGKARVKGKGKGKKA